MSKIAIVRIRGQFHLTPEQRDTFQHLNLPKKNSCVVLEATPSTMGMVKIVKDFVTWGPVSAETLKALDARKVAEGKYRLHPPRKGYGKKGIKVQYVAGGALGNRDEKINDLIQRMI